MFSVFVDSLVMSYISVAEEEGGEPIELPGEDDGTGEYCVAAL